MSSTRKAKDVSVFHQARFASSAEFERGLIANLVARRAAVLDDKADRELIWFIQYLSHQEGGLSAVAKDLLSKNGDKIQAGALEKLGSERNFRVNRQAIARETISRISGGTFKSPTYTKSELLEMGRTEACEIIEKFLCEMCLNPAIKLDAGPECFPSLIGTLRKYKAQFVKAKTDGVYITSLGQKVFDVLDYTVHCRGLTLMQGEARLGKSHAACAWCEQHPGEARFVEVPCGNDDATFFRDLARGIGLGNFLNYKVVQIRERVESVLLTRSITLVLDEAQRLWPQTNFREGFPKRIVWVMTMANAGVPIAMVSTPQFFITQKVIEKNGWNSAQLTGRLSHYESLPADLSLEDLIAVARVNLPEASDSVLDKLATYAQSSARYLAAIDSISKRARFLAMKNGRDSVTTDDVRKAMQESVIPADAKLQAALEAGKKTKLSNVSAASPLHHESTFEEVPLTLNDRQREFISHRKSDAAGTPLRRDVDPILTGG